MDDSADEEAAELDSDSSPDSVAADSLAEAVDDAVSFASELD